MLKKCIRLLSFIAGYTRKCLCMPVLYRTYIINNNCACSFFFSQISFKRICLYFYPVSSTSFSFSLISFFVVPLSMARSFFFNVPYTYKVIDSTAQVLNTNEIEKNTFFFLFSQKFIVCSCLNGKIAARR